jgi:hypothetical protein
MADRNPLNNRSAATVDRLGDGDPVIHPTPRLALSLIWPVERRPDEPCPGYRGRAPGAPAVGPVCYRSGADHLLSTVAKYMRPKAYRPDATLAGGVGTRVAKTTGRAKAGERKRAGRDASIDAQQREGKNEAKQGREIG